MLQLLSPNALDTDACQRRRAARRAGQCGRQPSAMRWVRRILLTGAMAMTMPAYAAEFRHAYENPPYVYYSGTATLRGSFVRRLDKETLDLVGDHLCFYPSGPSRALIPRGDADRRMPWFCFSNQLSARRLLKMSRDKAADSCGFQGRATIVVSDYVVDRRESEAHDLAHLVRVVSAARPTSIRCKK
jgi:hypothetical protein